MVNLPNRRGDGSNKQLVLSMRDSLPSSPWSWEKSTTTRSTRQELLGEFREFQPVVPFKLDEPSIRSECQVSTPWGCSGPIGHDQRTSAHSPVESIPFSVAL